MKAIDIPGCHIHVVDAKAVCPGLVAKVASQVVRRIDRLETRVETQLHRAFQLALISVHAVEADREARHIDGSEDGQTADMIQVVVGE